jgi:hypothetical protein
LPLQRKIEWAETGKLGDGTSSLDSVWGRRSICEIVFSGQVVGRHPPSAISFLAVAVGLTTLRRQKMRAARVLRLSVPELEV